MVKGMSTGQRGYSSLSACYKSRLPTMDAANPRTSSHRFTLAGADPYGGYVVPGSALLRVSFSSSASFDHDLQSYHQHGQLQSPSPFRRLGLPGAAATQTARRVRSFRSSMHCAQATVFLPVTAADGRPPPIVRSPAVVLPGCEATWEPPCTGTYGTVPHSAVRAAVLQLFVQQSVTRLGSSAYAPVG